MVEFRLVYGTKSAWSEGSSAKASAHTLYQLGSRRDLLQRAGLCVRDEAAGPRLS